MEQSKMAKLPFIDHLFILFSDAIKKTNLKKEGDHVMANISSQGEGGSFGARLQYCSPQRSGQVAASMPHRGELLWSAIVRPQQLRLSCHTQTNTSATSKGERRRRERNLIFTILWASNRALGDAKWAD